eukprot:scaffold90708_cov65-Phaeocystis_antarctica.AAC.1
MISFLRSGVGPSRGATRHVDIYVSRRKSSVTSARLQTWRDDGSALTVGADARGGGVLVLLCLAARALPPARTTSPRPCTCPTSRGR